MKATAPRGLALVLLVALAGCGATGAREGGAPPMQAEPAAEAPRGGFLGLLLGRGPATTREDDDGATATPAEGADAASDPEAAGGAGEAPDPAVVAAADAALGGAEPGTPAADLQTGADRPRGRFFARLFGGAARPGQDDAPVEAAPDGALPYGTVGTVCGVAVSSLGSETARYPEEGRARYRLYDSAPGDEGARSFYLDGFDDGCLRQFTAALVVFGGLPTYEAIRFGAAAATQPEAETDTAYDRIKRRVCNVGPSRPCGDRVDRLTDDTVFLTVYERAGTSLRWKNMLLHDGDLAAFDVVSR